MNSKQRHRYRDVTIYRDNRRSCWRFTFRTGTRNAAFTAASIADAQAIIDNLYLRRAMTHYEASRIRHLSNVREP